MLMLLPNYMHEFTRIQYSSPENKAKYSELLPRIQKINSGELDLELVLAGIRRGFITNKSPAEYPAYKSALESMGLYSVIIARNKINTNSFYGAVEEYNEGDPYVYRIAVCKTAEDMHRWLDTTDLTMGAERRDRLMGELLGYPQCCIDAFIQNWVTNNSIDPTFDQSKYVSGIGIQNRFVKSPTNPEEMVEETWHITLPVTVPFETSTMLRWAGIRLVPHLPCSWDCEHSIDMAQQVYAFRNKSRFTEEIEAIYEMLRWPVEWSVMHGIAEIYTPCFRIFTRGDCALQKYVVQKHSDYFPENGSKGNRFPFKTKKNKISESKSFKLSLIDYSAWEENGYATKEAMEEAHGLMLQAATSTTIPKGNVLDLGCGNGIFIETLHKELNKLHNDEFATVPCGVENKESRFKSALDRIYYGKLWWGDLYKKDTWELDTYALTVFMPGRILEQPSDRIEDIKWLVSSLPKTTEYLLVYLTSDWKETHTIQSALNMCGMTDDWQEVSKVLTNEQISVQLFKRFG